MAAPLGEARTTAAVGPGSRSLELQNSPGMLKLLRAKCAAYDKAQGVYRWQFSISVLLALCLAAMRAILPATAHYAAVGGIIIFLLDWALLEPQQKKLKLIGATLQEMFDCEVLALPWREQRVGPKLAVEDVERWASRHPSNVGLHNWYAAELVQLPLPFARVACQRSNARWNGDMRDRYARHLAVAAVLLASALLLSGILLGAALLTVLEWGATLLPLPMWMLREATRQRTSADDSRRVATRADQLWQRLLAGEDAKALEGDVRELQNDIFDQRRRDQQVFAWVYRRYRTEDERLMKVGAQAFVDEYNQG